MADEKELQRIYLQLQIMKKQLNDMMEKKLMVEQKINEIMNTINSVNHIRKTKKGEEVWVSLGSTLHVKTRIEDTENVAIGIGAGIVAKKTIDEAFEILEKRLNELVDINNQISDEVNQYSGQIEEMEKKFQEMAKELK
jgi:prefoldin alpha subunit